MTLDKRVSFAELREYELFAHWRITNVNGKRRETVTSIRKPGSAWHNRVHHLCTCFQTKHQTRPRCRTLQPFPLRRVVMGGTSKFWVLLSVRSRGGLSKTAFSDSSSWSGIDGKDKRLSELKTRFALYGVDNTSLQPVFASMSASMLASAHDVILTSSYYSAAKSAPELVEELSILENIGWLYVSIRSLWR